MATYDRLKFMRRVVVCISTMPFEIIHYFLSIPFDGHHSTQECGDSRMFEKSSVRMIVYVQLGWNIFLCVLSVNVHSFVSARLLSDKTDRLNKIGSESRLFQSSLQLTGVGFWTVSSVLFLLYPLFFSSWEFKLSHIDRIVRIGTLSERRVKTFRWSLGEIRLLTTVFQNVIICNWAISKALFGRFFFKNLTQYLFGL